MAIIHPEVMRIQAVRYEGAAESLDHLLNQCTVAGAYDCSGCKEARTRLHQLRKNAKRLRAAIAKAEGRGSGTDRHCADCDDCHAEGGCREGK